MILPLLIFLIGFPLIIAAIIVINRKASLMPFLVSLGASVLIFFSLGLLFTNISKQPIYFQAHASWIEPTIFILELLIALYLCFIALRRKDFWVTLFVLAQAALLVWFHKNFAESIHVQSNLFLDQFSVIMGLIAGVIGGLIAIYAIGYMKDFHHHHHEVKDRSSWFFGIIFLFLSAMFGVCFSNNLMWLYFFWEITTLCSFLLIGYKNDTQSQANAFWALRWNLLGGLAFIIGIILLQTQHHTIELSQMAGLTKTNVLLLAVGLISIAGMTKSAQMPFSSWLVGAMVAPTPVSALLHSSTMVKAGVYLVLRFAVVLQGTMVGMMVAIAGGITFLIASFICISQSDAKKVLAYSTIANLGLIILCAGVGTYEAVWAAMLLIIFHAISKGLLFLCVGTIEHQIGSRNIEDMTGLIIRMPKVSIMLQTGIAGMFLAPFGMLISKWAVLRALLDYNPVLGILIVYGSAATLFFWVKWMGKILIVDRNYSEAENTVSKGQWIVLTTLMIMTILICGFFTVVAHVLIDPYVKGIYGHVLSLSKGNLIIISFMLTMVCLFPITFMQYGRHVKVVDPYLGGANTESSTQFRGSLRDVKDMELQNYYMKDYFSEKRLNQLGVLLGIAFLIGIVVMGVI